jgi:hypothetical protein
MPPPVENNAAQGQLQDLQYVDRGYYDMANDHLPLHEHRDHAINNYDAVALDDPAQGRALPPAPVCSDPTFPYTHI